MTIKHGVKETKEVLSFILDFASVIFEALEDKKIDFEDAPLLLGLSDTAPAAFDKIADVPKELSDLSEEELEEMESAFDIEDDEEYDEEYDDTEEE